MCTNFSNNGAYYCQSSKKVGINSRLPCSYLLFFYCNSGINGNMEKVNIFIQKPFLLLDNRIELE